MRRPNAWRPAAAVIVLSLACARPSVAAPRRPLTIAALGDSITEGTIPSLPEIQASYPVLLARDLGPAWSVENFGVSGSTAEDVRRAWTRRVRGGRFSAVIVFAGVNDMRRGWRAKRSWEALHSTYDEIVGDGSALVAVTATPFRGSETGSGGHPKLRWSPDKQRELDALNHYIRDYCRPPRCVLVDAYQETLDPASPYTLRPAFDYGDRLHLSQIGLARLSALVRKALGEH